MSLFPKFKESEKSFLKSRRTRKNISFMPETQIYYHEGAADYNYVDGIYNNFPVMREVESFSGYRTGVLSFVNYFNQWGPQRSAGNNAGIIDRNIQLLAIPATIFPKRITSMSQVEPATARTGITSFQPLNPSGTFQGDKFRWFGTLQQIRIPACESFVHILGERNWLTGGYYYPTTKSEPADENARVGDTAQASVLTMTQRERMQASGTQSSTVVNLAINGQNYADSVTAASADKYQMVTPNQIVRAVPEDTLIVPWNKVVWNEETDQPRVINRVYFPLKFPMLLSPQFKPWICFRLITLKFKVSMNEWFQMSSELPYRLNTLFSNKQDNAYNIETTIQTQWDRSTRNSILAKPNPYGGTFKICKNKKIFVNPFKGKSITNWIYSKKRGKIINAKMWQPGQAPVAGITGTDYAQFGYYSNGLYVSLLLAPLNLERDFDAFTASVLREYFTARNGGQSSLTKSQFGYQYDVDVSTQSTIDYERRLLGVGIPNFPQFTSNLEIPYAIKLYDPNEILIKTQTKYCEY